MPICVLREELSDCDAWKRGFYAEMNANAARLESSGIALESVQRDCDDPNAILTTIRFASHEQGEAMLADPLSRTAMEANGVDHSTLRVECYEDPS